MTTRTVTIAGMTCAACEATVTQAALSLPGVEAASANARTGQVELRGAALPADDALDRVLADTPYSVTHQTAVRPPWVTRDHQVWRDVTVALAVVGAAALVIWAWGLDQRIQEFTQGAQAGSALVVLGLGVAASLSTCMALVGGLVVSLSASAGGVGTGRVQSGGGRSTGGTARSRLAPHLAFNAGRIVGFTALGALVGLAGRSFAPSGGLLNALVIAAAVVMTIVGVRLTGTSPRVAAWQLALPSAWGRWAASSRMRVASAGAEDGKESVAGKGAVAGEGAGATPGQPARVRGQLLRAGALGVATFFLPCGFTQAVQLFALSTGSARDGAIIMGLFAVGTTPGLLAAGVAASRARMRGGRALRFMGVVVLAFALITGGGAITQVAPGLLMRVTAPTERTANVADVAGVQQVTTAVRVDGYAPQVAVVYAGEPVSWTLTPEYFGCASLVRAPALGLPDITVLDGPQTVTFTLDQPGTYAYACAMGMYTGAFVAIERPD